LTPAIFLDRDGTIIEDNGYITSTKEVIIYPFAIKALKKLQNHFYLFIVTNQSGISLGKITKEDADKINQHILNILKSNEIYIKKIYCCSHAKSDNCKCIKPKPYFINKAVKEFGINISKSYSIGDHPHDVDFGRLAGATGLYVLTGHGKKHLNELSQNTLCFKNIYSAAEWIIKSNNY